MDGNFLVSFLWKRAQGSLAHLRPLDLIRTHDRIAWTPIKINQRCGMRASHITRGMRTIHATCGNRCPEIVEVNKLDTPSMTRPSPIQTSEPTSTSCFSGAHLRTSDIGTLPKYVLNPIHVASGSFPSLETTRRTILRRPSAPMITSAWRISPVLSLTEGRNVGELGSTIEVLVSFSGGVSGTGTTDSIAAPNVTRAPADEARLCSV